MSYGHNKLNITSEIKCRACAAKRPHARVQSSGGAGAAFNFRTNIIVIAAVVICAASARAQHSGAGTTAFPFLNINYEARSVAMGGAAAAVPNDGYGLMSNPAAIASVGKMQVMAGYRQLFMDVWGGPLGFVYPTPSGVFAANLVALTVGDFEFIDENNDATGRRAKSSYTAGGVTYARTLFSDNLAAGAALKAIYHYIGVDREIYTADAYALDLGAQYKTRGGRLIYGAALRNLGFIRSGYLNEFNEYPLPYTAEAGVCYIPRHTPNLRVAADINKTYGDYVNIEPGAEYEIIAKTLFLRGGYSFSSKDLEKVLEVLSGDRDEDYQKSNVHSLALGFGLSAAMDNVDIKFDAAIQFYTDISDPTLVVSLLVGF